MSPTYTLFFGTFIHLPRTPTGSEQKHELSIQYGALWVSGVDGRIKGFDWDVRDERALQALIRKKGWVVSDGDWKTKSAAETVTVQVVRAREAWNEFFFPGFIDTHIHAPQYPNAGIFGSSTLLDWLAKYTFPMESSFGNIDKTHTIYNQVITRTLSHGTTCASYFATVHVPATNLLADLCHSRGQRALIGRVCMDNPSFCPDYYRDASAEESISLTTESIQHIQTLDPEGELVKPIITPRFAPTCTTSALTSLGHLAASYSPPLHIQTHISENTNEVSLVHDLFPDCPNYASVYDKANLLTPRTILAHGVHLTPAEKTLIQSRGSKISHCPASNSALGSGICPVRSLLDAGIDVGLGTDVSGGYSSSILEAVRQACLVSRLLPHTHTHTHQTSKNEGADDEDRVKLSVEEGLYLATRGGASVIDMSDELGGFEMDMFFDSQLISLGSCSSSVAPARTATTNIEHGSIDIFNWEDWAEKVHKWVWNGDDRNVKGVWVNGRLVHSQGMAECQEESVADKLGLLGGWRLGSALGALGVGVLMGSWAVKGRI